MDDKKLTSKWQEPNIKTTSTNTLAVHLATTLDEMCDHVNAVLEEIARRGDINPISGILIGTAGDKALLIMEKCMRMNQLEQALRACGKHCCANENRCAVS